MLHLDGQEISTECYFLSFCILMDIRLVQSAIFFCHFAFRTTEDSWATLVSGLLWARAAECIFAACKPPGTSFRIWREFCIVAVVVVARGSVCSSDDCIWHETSGCEQPNSVSFFLVAVTFIHRPAECNGKTQFIFCMSSWLISLILSAGWWAVSAQHALSISLPLTLWRPIVSFRTRTSVKKQRIGCQRVNTITCTLLPS